MFAKTIIDSDAFLEMPTTSQLLYFHLAMRADDDGFVNKPKSLMRMVGCKDDDLKLLFVKKFLIPFESGVVVIKHWKIHNYIRKDTYTETKYKEEKSTLELDENSAYRIAETSPLHICDESVTSPSTQDRLGKDRLGEDRVGEDREGDEDINVPTKPSKRFTPPTVDEVREYCEERGNGVNPQRFVDYYSSNGWMVGKNKMKDWKAAVRTWEQKEKSYGRPAAPKSSSSFLDLVADYD
jgi:hypothetical protein